MSLNPEQIVNDNQNNQNGLLNLYLRKNKRKKNNNGTGSSNIKASNGNRMLDLLALLEQQANAVRQSLNPQFIDNDFNVQVSNNDINMIVGSQRHRDAFGKNSRNDNDNDIIDNAVEHKARGNIISFGNSNIEDKAINPFEINATSAQASGFNFDNFVQSNEVIQKDLFDEQEQERQRQLLEQQELERQRELLEQQEREKQRQLLEQQERERERQRQLLEQQE